MRLGFDDKVMMRSVAGRHQESGVSFAVFDRLARYMYLIHGVFSSHGASSTGATERLTFVFGPDKGAGVRPS